MTESKEQLGERVSGLSRALSEAREDLRRTGREIEEATVRAVETSPGEEAPTWELTELERERSQLEERVRTLAEVLKPLQAKLDRIHRDEANEAARLQDEEERARLERARVQAGQLQTINNRRRELLYEGGATFAAKGSEGMIQIAHAAEHKLCLEFGREATLYRDLTVEAEEFGLHWNEHARRYSMAGRPIERLEV